MSCLKNSSEPWAAVEQKWKDTTQTRLNLFKELTISEYFKQYPAPQKPKGYLLLEKDFDQLYAGQYTEITDLLTYDHGPEEISTIASITFECYKYTLEEFDKKVLAFL